MATLEQLVGALRQADSAGAYEDAKRIAEIIKQQQQIPEPPKEQAGFFSSLLGGAQTLGQAPEASKFALAKPDEQAAARSELLKAQEAEKATTSFEDVLSGKGKLSNWVAQTAGGSLGSLAAPAAAAGATALIPGVGPIAAPFVGGAVLAGQYLTSNIGRQAQEQQKAIETGKISEETSIGKATLGAAGETALDVFALGKLLRPIAKAFPIMGKLIGEGGETISKSAANQLADAFEKGTISYTKGVAKGIGRGAAFEIPTEVAQQALERWQAGLSLTDADARKEYLEAAAGAGLLGGGVGGVGGGINTAQNKAIGEQVLLGKQVREQRRKEALNPPAPPVAETSIAPVVKTAAEPANEYAADSDMTGDLGGVTPVEKDTTEEVSSKVIPEKIENPATIEELKSEVTRLTNTPAKTEKHRVDMNKKAGKYLLQISELQKAPAAPAAETLAAPAAETPAATTVTQDADKLKAEADAKAAEETRLKAEADAKLKAEQEKASAATTGTVGTGTGAGSVGASIQARASAGAATDATGGVGVGGAGTTVGKSDVGTEGKQPTLITEERQKAVDKAKIAVARQKPFDKTEDQKLADKAMDKIKAASFDAKALGLTEEEATREGKKVFAALKGTKPNKIKEKEIKDAADIIFSIPNKLKDTPKQQNNKKNALKYLVDVRDGITSESEVVEKEAAAASLEALIDTNTVSFDEIEAARDDLHKISDRFDKRTLNAAADELQLHKDHLRNQRALENQLFALTYKQDVNYEGNRKVKRIREELKEAKAITQAHLKEIQKKVPKKAKAATPEVRVLSEEEIKAQEAKQKQEQEDKEAAEEARREADIAADIELKKRLGGKKARIAAENVAGEEVEGFEGEIDPDTLLRSQTRKERGEAGMQVDEVQKVVDYIKSHWKDSPVIKVVQRIVDLPAETAMRLMNHGWEDTPGLFVPFADGGGMVYLIADNLSNQDKVLLTTVHEVAGHYGLRKILGAKYSGTMNSAYFNSTIKKAADKIRAENNTLSKEESVEEALAQLSEKEYNQPLIRGLIDRIVVLIRAGVRELFGADVFKGMSDVEVRRLLRASRTLLETGKGAGVGKVEGRAVMMSPPRKFNLGTSKDLSPEEIDAVHRKDLDEKVGTPSLTRRTYNMFIKPENRESLVRIFQNDRVALKTLNRKLELSGKVISDPDKKFNNLYDLIMLSAGKAFHYMTQDVGADMKNIDKAIVDYAKAAKIDIKDALAILHSHTIALHEPERRMVKYIRSVPLKKPAADRRFAILKELDQNTNLVSNGRAAQLREELDALIFKDPTKAKDKNNLTANVDPNGESPNGYKVTDIDGNEYNVIGGYTKAAIDRLKTRYDADPHKKELNALMKAVKKVQEGTTKLDKEANYWTQQVDNRVAFYGYDNYVPFKGRPDPVEGKDGNVDFSDPRSISREYVEGSYAFEGRQSDSDNPILQTLADAAKASLRAGRKDITQAIKNLIEQDFISGEPVKTIKFEERYDTNWKELQGPNKVFHYTKDGSIEIYNIKDPKIRESIRRTYQATNPLLQLANNLTSTIGQLHTRYNIAFAPMNFIRDSLTNAFTMGAEMGPKSSAAYIGAVASKVWGNGLYKAINVAALYQNNQVAKIKEMADKDSFVNDILEYLQEGGRVSYIQGIAVKGQFDELVKEVGRGGLIRKKEQLDKYVDLWTDMFELTSRAAAYSVAKTNFKAEFSKDKSMTPEAVEQAARTKAAAYAKNLANFEQVGEWGKQAGAMFMFFRPAATGAVRAYDAIKPAWEDVNKLIDSLPESIRADKTKNADGLTPVEVLKKNHTNLQKNARVMMAGLAGAGFTIYMMALMMAGDDELGRNKVATDDMARWTRYLRLPIPGTDRFLQIPWGFGLGAFAAAGAQLAGATAGKTSYGDMTANLISIGLDSYIPLPVSRMNFLDNPLAWAVDSVTPSVARPFVEYVMNVDSLGREIYNNRQSRFGDAYTGGDNIPEIYKSAAKFLVESTSGLPSGAVLDISPNTLYFFANNYVDGVSRLAQNIGDIGFWLTGSQEFNPKTNLMFFDSYIGNKSNFDAREFSAVENQIKNKEKLLKQFESKPELYAKYIENHPLDLALVDIYNKQVGGTLNQIRSQANMIRRSDMTPKERKEVLDSLTLAQNMIKRGLIDTFAAFDVTP